MGIKIKIKNVEKKKNNNKYFFTFNSCPTDFCAKLSFLVLPP